MFARVLTIALALWVAGCEKTSHESIDKWMGTQKGPGKLKKAFADEGLDADLSAHAGANLIKKGMDPDARAALETMSPGRRAQVIGKLAPRLWDLARVEDERLLPNPSQVSAKDALFGLRKWADDAQKQQIDAYMSDWYAVASYEKRAEMGANLGAAVVRQLGPAAGKKLMSVVSSVIAAPGQDKTRNRIHDELLLGLAASGNAEAVSYILDIAKMDRGDPSLPARAISALFKAYVDPGGLFDIVPPEPLVANVPKIVAIAKDTSQKGDTIDDAIALIRAVGGQACFEQLVAMIPVPHRGQFKYVVSTYALKCGGVSRIAEVVRALPDGAYDREELAGTVVLEISRMAPRDQVIAGLRSLLADRSTIAKWVAIETLASLKSVEDAAKIAALSGNKERLSGYWGETGKPDPTLGQRAKELAGLLK